MCVCMCVGAKRKVFIECVHRIQIAPKNNKIFLYFTVAFRFQFDFVGFALISLQIFDYDVDATNIQ